MPLFRKDVDFFFDQPIKVSTGGDGDASIWAVGSYCGKTIMTVIEKDIDSLTIDDVSSKPVFVTLGDLMKFSPY